MNRRSFISETSSTNRYNKRKTGTDYETIAARFLELKGYRVLERNFRCRTGEIDIIAEDQSDGSLCFAEVKYRSSLKYGYPKEEREFFTSFPDVKRTILLLWRSLFPLLKILYLFS